MFNISVLGKMTKLTSKNRKENKYRTWNNFLDNSIIKIIFTVNSLLYICTDDKTCSLFIQAVYAKQFTRIHCNILKTSIMLTVICVVYTVSRALRAQLSSQELRPGFWHCQQSLRTRWRHGLGSRNFPPPFYWEAILGYWAARRQRHRQMGTPASTRENANTQRYFMWLQPSVIIYTSFMILLAVAYSLHTLFMQLSMLQIL